MELLFIILIAALVVCIVLACCVFCCKYCRCGKSVYDEYEDSVPTKVTTTSSSKELNRSEYYSHSTPILRTSMPLPPSDTATNGRQSTPLLSSYSTKSPVTDADLTTTYFASPSSHSSTSGTPYSSTRNFYALEPARYETAYSEKTTSYTSENTAPYQVTTKTSYSAKQLPQTYSEDMFQQTQEPYNFLKRSSSQTSLYENN